MSDTPPQPTYSNTEKPRVNRITIIREAMLRTGLADRKDGETWYLEKVQHVLIQSVFSEKKQKRSQIRRIVLGVIAEHDLSEYVINPKRRSTKQMERYSSAEEWLDELLDQLVENGFLKGE
jgi:hypothetical protein